MCITLVDFVISLKALVGALVWKTSSKDKATLAQSSFRIFEDGCLVEGLVAQFLFIATICWNLVRGRGWCI
jgi:hypothetical protein